MAVRAAGADARDRRVTQIAISARPARRVLRTVVLPSQHSPRRTPWLMAGGGASHMTTWSRLLALGNKSTALLAAASGWNRTDAAQAMPARSSVPVLPRRSLRQDTDDVRDAMP